MTKKMKIIVKNDPQKVVFSPPKDPPEIDFLPPPRCRFFHFSVFVQMWSLDGIYRISYFLESVPRFWV